MTVFSLLLRTAVAAVLPALALLPAHAADAGEPARPSTDVAAEPAARLTVDAPLAGPLSKGVVVLPFHAEHMAILPVYGPAATGVAPRVGHLHLTLDHAPWHWLQASNDLIVLQGLPAGAHTLTVDLADANHHVVDTRTVDFTIAAR